MQGFGSMDVLCMDKTGTLTNESILLEYYMDVLGNESGQVLDFAFLNSAFHSGVCNPIDNAILACQTMPGHEQHFSDLLMRYQKEDEIPFDYSRKFVSTLVTDKNGDCQLIMKGNISQIVSRCSHVEFRGEILPMEKNGMQSVASVVDEMLQDGMKVIAVARKKIEKQDQIIPTDENNMILMGYLAFFDAPKKTAKTSVEALKRLQVTPKILTGDQADVAASICRRVKIPSEIILTGADLDQMTDDELGKTVEDIHVFAESLGYSDYYFTRKFKQETGISIKEYVLQQKMELAKHLLIDTSLSIAAISDQLNICSQSYFGDLFRKHVGTSPLEFREKGCL